MLRTATIATKNIQLYPSDEEVTVFCHELFCSRNKKNDEEIEAKKKAAMNSLLGMLSSDKRFSRYIWCSVFIISSTFVMISFRTLQSDRNHDESKRETPQLLKFISSFEQKETFFPSVTIYSCTFSWTCQ